MNPNHNLCYYKNSKSREREDFAVLAGKGRKEYKEKEKRA
jgi:hypothetical protein